MVLCGVLLAALAVLIGRRAVELQVRETEQLKELGAHNHLRELEIPARRGRILDRNGTELASSTEHDSIFCNPRQVVHVPDAGRKLAQALKMDSREVQKIIGRQSYFAWLKRRVSAEESARVRTLNLRGVFVRKEPKRVYPYNELGSTVVGHANVDGRGLDGVELAYDQFLRGRGVQLAGLRDGSGRDMLIEGGVDPTASAGRDVVLSLDKYLTYIAEDRLARGLEKHKAKAGVAIMMDPQTGEILALASAPGYNPNDPRDAATRGARNRAITDVIEPGSTMKTFTFAAALHVGKVRPEDRFDCQMGRMQIGKHTIRDDHPKGILTAAEVFTHSSNIGSVKIARRIGKEALHDALARFGFGRSTGVGLVGERSGTLHPVRRWGEIEFATHAFGQGMTATPLQLVAAFSAIASGGMYRPPRLALRVVYPDGREEAVRPKPGARGPERVISPTAAQTLLTIMRGVTEDGTAKLAAIDGYPVAGKTGTAQKVVNGRYDPHKYVASFVGIVPADKPRLVIAVIVDEPQPIHYGGVVAAPVWKEIAEAGLRYLGIAPSVPIIAEKGGKTAYKPEEKSAGAMPAAVVEGPGSDLPPVEGEDTLDAGQSMAQAASSGSEGGVRGVSGELVALPDFSGMSMGEVIRRARWAGVEIVPEGSGVAVSQDPSPGSMARGSICRVTFKPGG